MHRRSVNGQQRRLGLFVGEQQGGHAFKDSAVIQRARELQHNWGNPKNLWIAALSMCLAGVCFVAQKYTRGFAWANMIPLFELLAVLFVARSIVAVKRYRTPPPALDLTARQMTLVGLDPTAAASAQGYRPPTQVMSPTQTSPAAPVPSPPGSSVGVPYVPPPPMAYGASMSPGPTSPSADVSYSFGMSLSRMMDPGEASYGGLARVTSPQYAERERGGGSWGAQSPLRMDSPSASWFSNRSATSPPPSRYALAQSGRVFSPPAQHSPGNLVGYAGGGEVNNQATLHSYLHHQQQLSLQDPRTGDGYEEVPNYAAMQYQLPKYKTARRPVAAPSTTKGTKNSRGSLRAAEELLRELHIARHFDQWTARCRTWLAGVLRYYVEAMDKVDAELSREDIGMPQLTIKSMDDRGIRSSPLSHPTQRQGNTMMTTAQNSLSEFTLGDLELFAMNSRDPLVHAVTKRRLEIEDFLSVKGGNNRKYIVERFQALADGSVLAAFSATGGGRWKGKAWTDTLPSDADMLMHVFCTFLDHKSPNDPHSAFSVRHFSTSDDGDGGSSQDVVIYQSSRNPPHFKLRVRCESKKSGGMSGKVAYEVWEPVPGRNNVFASIALFAYYCTSRLGGYVDTINLSAPTIGLSQVVDK